MTSTSSVVRRAEDSTVVTVLGRLGMVCYGLVYVIVAVLTARVAIGDNSQQADQHGAIEEIAGSTFGGLLIWVLAIGLLAFGLWQLLMAAVSFQWRTKKRSRTFKRIGAGIRGVVAIGLGIAAIKIAVGSGDSGGGNQKEQSATAKLLELPAGRILVAIVAIAVISAGVASIVSGIRGSFMKDLDTSRLPAGSRRFVERIGAVGNVAKGAAIAIVGLLLGVAALQSNPGKAGGLDAALRTLAAQPFGAVLLWAMAVGFAAFGVYCFAAARCHRT